MVLALLGVNNADFDDHASEDFPVDKVAYELMDFDEIPLRLSRTDPAPPIRILSSP